MAAGSRHISMLRQRLPGAAQSLSPLQAVAKLRTIPRRLSISEPLPCLSQCPRSNATLPSLGSFSVQMRYNSYAKSIIRHSAFFQQVRFFSSLTKGSRTNENESECEEIVRSSSVDSLTPFIDRSVSQVSLDHPLAVGKDEIVEGERDQEIDILEELENPEVLSHYAEMPLMPETYTLASYVDQSETLQKLVQMGVDLSKIQKRRGVASMLMRMDFERDIKDKLTFLHHCGLPGEELGSFVTKNPFILGEELQNLEARVHYLQEMKFSPEAISQIISRAPYFLNFSIERIDNKLGYYQQLFGFSDANVRAIITRCPKLVTGKVSQPKENLFVLEFQCGFSKSALRNMVLQEPSILLRGKQALIDTFDYLHNTMKIPHKLLLGSPGVFLGRIDRVKDRHKFLVHKKRNQYSPKEPGYISLMALFKVPDDAFCQKIAKVSEEEYNHFLKTCRL